MKIVERTCIACRKKKDKSQLKRILVVKTDCSINKVLWDKSNVSQGRGAWICCDSKSCLEKILKKGILERAFKISGKIDYQQLLA